MMTSRLRTAALVALCTIAALLLTPLVALANGNHGGGAPQATSVSGSSPVTQVDTRVIALPGGGNVSAAICTQWRWYAWGAYGTLDTSVDCVRDVLALQALHAKPVPTAERYPMADEGQLASLGPVCTPLARKTALGRRCGKQ